MIIGVYPLSPGWEGKQRTARPTTTSTRPLVLSISPLRPPTISLPTPAALRSVTCNETTKNQREGASPGRFSHRCTMYVVSPVWPLRALIRELGEGRGVYARIRPLCLLCTWPPYLLR